MVIAISSRGRCFRISPEPLLCRSRRRAVVVGQIEVGDAAVEGRKDDLLADIFVGFRAKVVPAPEADYGNRQAGCTEPTVRHTSEGGALISCGSCQRGTPRDRAHPVSSLAEPALPERRPWTVSRPVDLDTAPQSHRRTAHARFRHDPHLGVARASTSRARWTCGSSHRGDGDGRLLPLPPGVWLSLFVSPCTDSSGDLSKGP